MAVPSLFSLENRTAMVTGGTRGIGAQMAIALAEAGADIILVQVRFLWMTGLSHKWTNIDSFFQRDTSNQDTKRVIESLGRKATIYTADLASRKAVSSLTKTVLGDGHDISILVTCAGIQRRHPAEKFPDSDWDEVSQVATYMDACSYPLKEIISKPNNRSWPSTTPWGPGKLGSSSQSHNRLHTLSWCRRVHADACPVSRHRIIFARRRI